MDPITVLILWAIVGGLVGAAVGIGKGRPLGGFILGAIVGPVGWLLVATGPSMHPKCPACLGTVPKGARKCMHCGESLPAGEEEREEEAPLARPPSAGEDLELDEGDN